MHPYESNTESLNELQQQNQPLIINYDEGSSLQMQSQQQQDPNTTQQADEELRKKIALYYHTLFQGSLGQWFLLMQQRNYSKLTKQQYIDLNIRIQKSLILDFDIEQAQESALEDWKIDIERENFERFTQKQNATQVPIPDITGSPASEPDSNINPQKEPYFIEFERLSEFFFDLCLSWCQYLDIETFLFFVNGIFLNITKGSHVNVSNFKDMNEIEVLSIEFFNQLLKYRSACELQSDKGESYLEWYSRNFSRQHEIIRSVEKNLSEAFKDKNEIRIMDLWVDMPVQAENHYINQHFDKLDKDLKMMNKALRATDKLTHTITMIDQIKKMSVNDKSKKELSYRVNQPIVGDPARQQMSDQTFSYIQLNSGKPGATNLIKKPLKLSQNTKEQRQGDIEKLLVGQLGDRFKNAKLLEVTDNSYLITQDVRLPIFGRKAMLLERQKSSISKRGHLLKSDSQYINRNQSQLEQESSKQEKNIIYDRVNQQQAGKHGATFESESDPFFHQQPIQQQQLYTNEQSYLYNQRAIDQQNVSSFLGANQTHINPNLSNVLGDDSQILTQQQPLHTSKQSAYQIDEKTLKIVYDRYLQLLQDDQNPQIDQILQEQEIATQVQDLSGIDGREIEAAVLEKLQAEEESAEIQDMIARFYNKFDELHEISINQTLARSPNKNQVKNEIKYKIPERWTKKFHKFDVVPLSIYKSGAVQDERGRVNKASIVTQQQQKKERQSQLSKYTGQTMPQQQQQYPIPLSNSVIKESLSSRATPKSEINKANAFESPTQKNKDQLVIYQNIQLDPNEQVTQLSPKQDHKDHQQPTDDLAESTDVSKAGDFTRQGSENKSFFQQQFYDWSEVAYLFEDGQVPEELKQITDPIEYNYILVRLKKDFNDKNKSEFLKYMGLQLPYHSRRDEIGGAISNEEWSGFVNRLEGIIDKVKKKRIRMIRRRKKKGIKKMPRKTLFKPVPRPNLANDPLWKEVFLDQSDDGQDSDIDVFEIDTKAIKDDIYKIGLAKMRGSQSILQSQTKNQSLGGTGVTRQYPSTQKNGKRNNKTQLQISGGDEFFLPPIMRPLLYEDFKDTGKQQASTGKLRTAEQNLKATVENYPPSVKNMLNMKYKDYYHDPFDRDPHQAARVVSPDTKKLQRVEHTYKKKIKKQKQLNLIMLNETTRQ